jgi:hypothetical protein
MSAIDPYPAENRPPSSPDPSVNSVLIIEDENRYPVLLKFTLSKNMFLTKVSFYFMLYMVFVSAVCILIFENLNLAKLYYRLWYLNYIDFFVFAIWGFLKVCFWVFGNAVRKVAGYIFLVDCFLSMLCTLGLYFRMENFISLPYVYTGHYLIIYITCIAMSAIAFFVTTIYRDGPNIYSVSKGVIFMSACDLIPLLIYQEKWSEVYMTGTRYMFIWLTLVVFNFYLARNSWLLVNCRGEKFYDHEHVYAFECYFTDWIYAFWVDKKEEAVDRKNESDSVTESQSYTDESKADPTPVRVLPADGQSVSMQQSARDSEVERSAAEAA